MPSKNRVSTRDPLARGASRARATKKVATKPPVKCRAVKVATEPFTKQIMITLRGDRDAVQKLLTALLDVVDALASLSPVEAFGTLTVPTAETCR